MINNFKNVKEAALFLERTERCITGLCNKGEFPGAQKEGLMWFIPEDALIAYKVKYPKKNRRSKSRAEAEQNARDAKLIQRARASTAAARLQLDEGGDV